MNGITKLQPGDQVDQYLLIKEAKKVKLAPVDQEIAIQGNINGVFLNRIVKNFRY